MDFIEKLPDGFDTLIGENGGELSGGERQRLQYLTSVMRGEQTEQILKSMGAEFGQAIVDIDVGAKDRLKAAEMLGKTHKLFTDKIENATEVLVIQDDI